MRTAPAIPSTAVPSRRGPLARGRTDGPVEGVREAVEWTYRPWRDRPGRAWTAAAAAAGFCLLVLALGLAPLTTLLLCVVLVSSVAPGFMPARCRVDGEGVALRGPGGWTARRWADIRRARAGRRGLFVSPFSSRHWMDAWRSLFLPFPAPDADGLIRAVGRHLEDHDLAA